MLDALFSKTQQRVLTLLFGQPDRSFVISELIQLAAAGSGAVQRELQRLTASGLVTCTPLDGRKRYRANADSALFADLRAVVAKTTGIAPMLRAALASAAGSISLAVLYGSIAKGRETGSSDVDVLLVSDELTLEQVFSLLAPVEKQLSRTISPTLYTTAEFRRRREARHPFLTKVLAGEHIVLLGDADALGSPRQPGPHREPQDRAS